ncbi:MAG TPA: hypothetical protein VM847_16645 [Tahibacter sp.]|nr:hypothetical protein [Tahibacter sp.]
MIELHAKNSTIAKLAASPRSQEMVGSKTAANVFTGFRTARLHAGRNRDAAARPPPALPSPPEKGDARFATVTVRAGH